MPEKIRFKPPEELREEEIRRRIEERGPEEEILGGIVFEEELDPETKEKKRYVYIGNPYKEDSHIIKLETDATKEDIEAIKREIIPTEEAFEILSVCARSYRMHHGLIFEGPTAVGKTFLVEKFTELLYGRGVKPLDFYCSGQTDVSELMARWVPAVETEEDKKRWNEFLESKEGREDLSKIAKDIEKEENLSPEQKRALITSRLSEIAKSQGIGVRQWRLQMGVVPKSMGLTRDPDGSFSFDEEKGEGFILHIEEVGLAEPQIINALLKLRGKRGELTKFIQLWEDGGRTIKAGEKWWVVMSTNPPEEYGSGREPVDAALSRGFDYKILRSISPESYRLAAKYYFTYRVGEKPKPKEKPILDIYNHPEIGEAIAEVMGAFHNDIVGALKFGERGRETRILFTLDQMASVAQQIIIKDFQKRNKETGYLDLCKTLKLAIEDYYLDRLADEDLKQTIRENLDRLLGLSISEEELSRIRETEDILKGGKDLPLGVVLFEGEIITRKEFFDILVKRASMTGEEKREIVEQKKRKEEAELRKAQFDAEDALEDLMKDSNISESIKKHLKT